MITKDSKRVLFLVLILIFGGIFGNQAKGTEPIPQIWEIADDISMIESILHSTLLTEIYLADRFKVKKAAKKMFTIDLDRLEQRNLTGFQQDLVEITRVFDENWPGEEGSQGSGTMKKGMLLMAKFEDLSSLEHQMVDLKVLRKIGGLLRLFPHDAFLGFSYLEKINNYPMFQNRADAIFVRRVEKSANDTLVLISIWEELAREAAALNATRAEENLDELVVWHKGMLDLGPEQVLLDRFATSVETLKSRTEKFRTIEEKVGKTISVLTWLEGIEDGVMDPFNNHSFIPNVRFSDIERVSNGMIEKRLSTLAKLDVELIKRQLNPLKNAKKRLEKWLSVRRAIKESGGASVYSANIRSSLEILKKGLDKMQTVKSVKVCTDLFHLAHFNLSRSDTSMEKRRKVLMDEIVPEFTQVGFNDDDINTLKELMNYDEDLVALINKWKQIQNLPSLLAKLVKMGDQYYPFLENEEPEYLETWLRSSGIVNGSACMQRDGRIGSANETVLSEMTPLYSNDSQLPLIVEMATNLTQIEQMWKSEVDEKMSTSDGKLINDDIGELTDKFSQLAAAFRAAAFVIRFPTEFQAVYDKLDMINQTLTALPNDTKKAMRWTSEVVVCIHELKNMSTTLKTRYDSLKKYDSLEVLTWMLESLQGDSNCNHPDFFHNLYRLTNESWRDSVGAVRNLNLTFTSVKDVSFVLKETAQLLQNIGKEDATTTVPTSSNDKSQDDVTSVPTNAESFKQVQDQNSINNKSEDGDDESAVSSVVWIIIVLVVLLVIAGLSVAVYFRFFHKKTKRESSEVEKKTENVDKTAGTTAGSGEKIQKDSITGNVADLP